MGLVGRAWVLPISRLLAEPEPRAKLAPQSYSKCGALSRTEHDTDFCQCYEEF